MPDSTSAPHGWEQDNEIGEIKSDDSSHPYSDCGCAAIQCRHNTPDQEMPSDPFDTDLIRVVVVRVPVPDPVLKMAVGVLSVCLAYLMADIIFGGAKDA